jgi:ankyrin repeat protein
MTSNSATRINVDNISRIISFCCGNIGQFNTIRSINNSWKDVADNHSAHTWSRLATVKNIIHSMIHDEIRMLTNAVFMKKELDYARITDSVITMYSGKYARLIVDMKIIGNYDEALMSACYNCGKEIVELFLDNGANVNFTNYHGTPLYIAIENGKTEVAKFLISREADVNFIDRDGNSLLYLAAKKYDAEIVKFLISRRVKVGKTYILLAQLANRYNDSYFLEPYKYLEPEADICSLFGEIVYKELTGAIKFLIDLNVDLRKVVEKGNVMFFLKLCIRSNKFALFREFESKYNSSLLSKEGIFGNLFSNYSHGCNSHAFIDVLKAIPRNLIRPNELCFTDIIYHSFEVIDWLILMGYDIRGFERVKDVDENIIQIYTREVKFPKINYLNHFLRKGVDGNYGNSAEKLKEAINKRKR